MAVRSIDHDRQSSRALRPKPHRGDARRQRSNRDLHLAVRSAQRRRLHHSSRGHRPEPQRGRLNRDTARGARMAGTGLGRRPRRWRAVRAVLSVPATGAVHRSRRHPRRRQPRLPLLLFRRAARRAPAQPQGAGRLVGLRRTLPRPVYRRAGRARERRRAGGGALPYAEGGQDNPRGHDPRRSHVRKPADRRLCNAALPTAFPPTTSRTLSTTTTCVSAT